MNCENLQKNFSLYVDEILSENESLPIEQHLLKCEKCQRHLSQIEDLKRVMKNLKRPPMPEKLTFSVKSAVSQELRNGEKQTFISKELREFLQIRILPYTIGTVATLLFYFGLLNSVFSIKQPSLMDTTARQPEVEVQMLAFSDKNFSANEEIPLSPADFANSRRGFGQESPSINPTGAIVALANTIVRDEMREEEVVLVADVFGNGLARVSQIVEAPKNSKTMEKLEFALQHDKDFAPFVPADLDHRAENVQIVLKIQKVNIFEKDSKNKRKSRKA